MDICLLIQRATRVTRTTVTAIDYILTEAIPESTVHSGIIKASISDHFPIFAILENSFNKNKKCEISVMKTFKIFNFC